MGTNVTTNKLAATAGHLERGYIPGTSRSSPAATRFWTRF
jgi:hypothetical protein